MPRIGAFVFSPREGFPPSVPSITFLIQARKDPARSVIGRVAQLVRALLSHSRGPGFESLHAHLVG